MLPWYLFPIAGGAVATVLGTGFLLAMTGAAGERLEPPPDRPIARPVAAGDFHILALGDSITRGVGDTGERGYVGRVADALRRGDRPVVVTNLAVSGEETGDVRARLQGGQLDARIASADLVLLSAGGNDFSHTLRVRGDGDDDGDPETARARARDNLRAIVARIRAANPDVPVRLVGLYNPFRVEPGREAEARAELWSWMGALDAATRDHPDVLLVPIADLFDDRSDRLAGDRYHPGPAGHAEIAARVLATLRDAN